MIDEPEMYYYFVQDNDWRRAKTAQTFQGKVERCPRMLFFFLFLSDHYYYWASFAYFEVPDDGRVGARWFNLVHFLCQKVIYVQPYMIIL